MTISINDNTQCFVSKTSGTMIDIINPSSGKTFYFSRTRDDLLAKGYKDVEIMTIGEWGEWKAAQQRTPISWDEEITGERFYRMLECLPPAAGTNGWKEFLIGEPCDHDALSGEPRFDGFRRVGNRYFASSRPLTVTEFRAEVGETM